MTLYLFQKFLFKTQQKEEELKDVIQLCRDLAAEGYSSNAKAAQEQLSNLEKQLNRLQERGKTRSDDIDQALARVGSFYNLFQAVMGDINDVCTFPLISVALCDPLSKFDHIEFRYGNSHASRFEEKCYQFPYLWFCNALAGVCDMILLFIVCAVV